MKHTVREITDDELLTWQIMFAKEGALPPEAQRRLLEWVSEATIVVPA